MAKTHIKAKIPYRTNRCGQYFDLLVASSAGRSGVAARFLKLVCKPSREETEVVDAGQRACEMSEQALKIVQQIANDGSSQYFFVCPPEGGACSS